MSVAVTTANGLTQLATGSNWGIVEGYLTVADDSGASLASYAPGAWQSVEVIPS